MNQAVADLLWSNLVHEVCRLTIAFECLMAMDPSETFMKYVFVEPLECFAVTLHGTAHRDAFHVAVHPRSRSRLVSLMWI